MKQTMLLSLLSLCMAWACGGGSRTEGDADVQQDVDAADTADTAADPDAQDIPQDRDATDPVPDPVDVHEEDAAHDAADAADATDAADDELPSEYDGVLCGYGICMAPEICCWRDGYPPTPECMTEEACLACDSCFFPQRCDGPEDCPGSQSCCYYGGDFLSESTCTDAAGCDRQCHDEDDCDAGELCCGYLTEHHILLQHCFDGDICPP